MKDDKVIETEVVNGEATEVAEAKKSIFDKPKAFIEKHSGTIKAIALAGLAGLAGYAIGKQVSKNSDDEDVVDTDYTEVEDDYNSDVKTTEF